MWSKLELEGSGGMLPMKIKCQEIQFGDVLEWSVASSGNMTIKIFKRDYAIEIDIHVHVTQGVGI